MMTPCPLCADHDVHPCHHDARREAFFSEASFVWLARQLGMSVEFPAPDVVLLQKHALDGD